MQSAISPCTTSPWNCRMLQPQWPTCRTASSLAKSLSGARPVPRGGNSQFRGTRQAMQLITKNYGQVPTVTASVASFFDAFRPTTRAEGLHGSNDWRTLLRVVRSVGC